MYPVQKQIYFIRCFKQTNPYREKSYKCDLCVKRFFDSINLTTHKHIHTERNLLLCDICEKGIYQSSQLIRHKQLHTGKSQLKCSLCEKGFTSSSVLTILKRTLVNVIYVKRDLNIN